MIKGVRAPLLWTLAAVLAALSIYFVPRSYRHLRQSQKVYELVDEVLEQLDRTTLVGEFDVFPIELKNLDESLVTAPSLYPMPVLSKADELKARTWAASRAKHAPLPENFFRSPPYQHPMGGSWAWFAYQNDPEFSSEAWLKQHFNYLHVIELASVMPTTDANRLWKEVILSLTPTDLSLVYDRNVELVVNDRFVLFSRPLYKFKSRENGGDYRVYSAKTWNQLLRDSILELRRASDTECLMNEGPSTCWAINNQKVEQARALLVTFGAGLFGLLGLIIIQLLRDRAKTRAREAADRLLMVQTLTHELRHPATGMRLSLETFRDHYDNLSDTLREEFLRMTGQMQKLQRLIFASEQYLQADNKQRLFSFKKIKVESFNEYLVDLLEAYQEKISVEVLKSDAPVLIDPYWFGMCISNLVKNALMHGQKPIRVWAEMENSTLKVSIQDSGSGLPGGKLDLAGGRKQSSKGGMGLGLSLVARIVGLMGGEISYRHEPSPTFTLKMEIT